MPKPLSEYGLRDWSRLRPLLHALKTRRYRAVTAAYVRQPPRAGDLDGLRRRIAGGRVMFTVAFQDEEMLRHHILAIRRFTPGPLHVIADNSRDDAAAARLEALCQSLETPYLRLPPNPWGPKSPSRSHGLALDWLWRQVILPGQPDQFGFLDHDLIPTAPDDPFEPLARGPLHGDLRWAGRRWYLWAGYCFFRTRFLAPLAVDFGQDWFIDLDTGGGNWDPVYSKMDPASIEQRPLEEVAILPGVPASECYIERRGAWVHMVGHGGRMDLKDAKRARFLGLIQAALVSFEGDNPSARR
jgi:hypothetical protein